MLELFAPCEIAMERGIVSVHMYVHKKKISFFPSTSSRLVGVAIRFCMVINGIAYYLYQLFGALQLCRTELLYRGTCRDELRLVQWRFRFSFTFLYPRFIHTSYHSPSAVARIDRDLKR